MKENSKEMSDLACWQARKGKKKKKQHKNRGTKGANLFIRKKMKWSIKETVWQSMVIVAGTGGESHIQCIEVPEQRHRVRIKQKTIKDQ